MANDAIVRCFWAQRIKISSSSRSISQTAMMVSKLRVNGWVQTEPSGRTRDAYIVEYIEQYHRIISISLLQYHIFLDELK